MLIYGVPDIIFTDEGTHFTAKKVEKLLKSLSIEHIKTAAYSPHSNGICERFNATIVDILATIAENDETNWDKYLPEAISFYNANIHSATQNSPNDLVFNYKKEMDSITVNKKQAISYATLLEKKNMSLNKLKEVKERLVENRIENEKEIRFSEGEEVLLKKMVRENEDRKKLTDRFEGPCIIRKVINDSMVILWNPRTRKETTQHIMNLKKYYKRLSYKQILDEKQKDEEEEVEGKQEERNTSTGRNRKLTQRFGNFIPQDYLDFYEEGT